MPGNNSPPVMSNQVKLLLPQRIGKLRHIVDQVDNTVRKP